MHVVLILLAVALVGYIAFHWSKSSAAPTAGAPADREQPFAFLANGMLFCRERGGDVKQVHSTYAQESLDRQERLRENRSWRAGTSFRVTAGGGARDFAETIVPLRATSAAYVPNGDLLYFLKDEGIGGLFRHEAASGKELRVLLKPGLHLEGITPSPDGSQIAAASLQTNGASNIALVAGDGNNLRELTGGDSADTSPAWIASAPKRLLFQSAGLARNEQGYVVAQGHTTIQMLNMETGVVSPVLEDDAVDYIKPRVSPEGNLLFIRRPYEPPTYSTKSAFLDALLFPFRLLTAIFHYLNFFSLMYSRKPLTSASGPLVKADMKEILLQGRRIDAEKALRGARQVHGVPSLVPDSWQLVSRDTAGNERVLATSVASYDVYADGTIVYSNGCGVFVLAADGSTRLAHTERLVADVIAG
jgi:hypothetical protein